MCIKATKINSQVRVSECNWVEIKLEVISKGFKFIFGLTGRSQGRRRLFMVGVWVKVLAPWLADEKKFCQHTLKQTPKWRNLDENMNDSKSHIWNSLSENIISRIQLFYIRPHVLVDIISFFFFNFRFSNRKSQSQQKPVKKITHFTIQFCSENLAHFANLNSLDIGNSILLQHSQKPFSRYKFSSKDIVFGVRKSICTAPFLDAQELHYWSTLKANVFIFLYISVRKRLSQRCSKIWTSRVKLWLNFSKKSLSLNIK